MNNPLEEYLLRMSSEESPLLTEIYRHTHLTTIYPRQLSGPLQGKFLEMISLMLRPQRILEIGTFTAYSTLCLLKGLDPNGEMVTIEADEELETTIRRHLRMAGEEKRVRLIIGRAMEVLPKLEGSFDLIFLDADKAGYPTYYPILRQMLRAGGFLLADNVLWNRKVIDPAQNDAETLAIREFNQLVANDPIVSQVLLPIRDGLSIIRKE
ncbi:MAG: O-methyltransferase [Bacteroidales bacterium]|nr:O-methyltransferase [Bacteroidales bacterium]